ncbi:hypothetical protein CTZ27_17665 [Streptomyces griseocarneus]|nr:hypothetical protein CTZ27_17665 [Streptomyces griseocarneus]
MTPERQPLAAPCHGATTGTGPGVDVRDPPVPEPARSAADPPGGDPLPHTDRLPGKGMDRAWPIVVHSRARHKRFITSE